MSDLERMAREAGAMNVARPGVLTPAGERFWGYYMTPEGLASFADLIRADERERCAKVCESMHDEDRPSDYSAAIRAN